MNTKILKQKILQTTLSGKWKTVKLGEVCEIFGRIGFRGYTREDLVSEREGVITLSPSNIIDGKMNYDKCTYISWFKYEQSPEIKIFNDDILVVKTGSSYGKCALVDNLPKEATINPQFVVLKNIKCDKKYLNYVLSSDYARKCFDEFVVGTAIPTFTQKNLANITFPFPPLAVQKSIVERIETLFAEIDRIEQSRQNLLQAVKLTKQKVLAELLNNDEWETVKLGDVCEYGKCKTVKNSDIPDEAWVLDLEDIEKDTGKLLQRTLKTDKNTTSVRHSFKKGDVLYSKLRTYLNKVLVADLDGFCTTEIIPIDFKGKVIPEFARYVLMSSEFLDYTAQCGYGVKMPRLGTNDAKKAPFPLPPLAVQQQIVAKIERIFAEIERIEKAVKIK
jgi:restriction endonuclease S subunit